MRRIDQSIKTNLKRYACFLAAWSALALSSLAATPPPDKLLVSDTLAVFTVPDYAKAKATWAHWPLSQLWADAALKPFAEKFMGKFKTEMLAPMEREFGLKFADFADLAQGQFTLAVTQNGWDGKSDQIPGFLLLLDTKDKSEVLKTNLTNLKKKWVDSGKQIKSEKIRDVDFTTLMFSTDDLSKAMDKALPDPNAGNETLEAPKPKKPGKKLEWLIGQSDSLLILGSSSKDIEKILIRQSGGAVPSLSEQASFAASYSARFRDSVSYGWLNVKAIVDTFVKQAAGASGAGGQNPMMPRPDKILSAVGLTGVQNLSFSVKDSPDGCLMDAQLTLPESERAGLFKIFAAEAKDSGPPAFVPADAVKFTRWRLDLQKAWATIENMIAEISPQGAVGIKAMIDYAGKDKDPDFDLRKNLIANLGDDFISYQKNPRKQTLADLGSPPTLFLVGSAKAEQLAGAVKALSSFLPQQSKLKEREFLGRKVYSMGLPGAGAGRVRGKPADSTLSYAASGGYLALSTDTAMLEEFLRGNDGKSLREMSGLAEAAQKVGGLGTGLFNFQNDSEGMRMTLETLKKESGTLANLLSASPFAGRLGMEEDSKKFKEWVDFSLLPNFDAISRYFYFTLWSGSVNSQGFEMKMFAPNSPQSKK